MGQKLSRGARIGRNLVWLQFGSVLGRRSMDIRVLNSNESETKAEKGLELAFDPVSLSKTLHQSILRLKGQYMGEDGSVKYKELRGSEEYKEFVKETGNLGLVDLRRSSEDERKAFFLNIYNTLTVHALAAIVDEEKSVLELPKFWQANVYKIGAENFSLDDIEHGILRSNKEHPSTKKRFFEKGDPRLELVLKELDPRLHFALNCGAKSCPPIRLFTTENLEKALDLAAKSFCQNDISIDLEHRKITLSKILQWYGSDFGSDEKEILMRLKEFLTDEQKDSLELLMESKFKVAYADYSWKIH